ncbi:hypothetical protein [Anaeroselena agilis]|uniref:Uncharacterized protein n=1 Tax=Anaeroselena agilis TaxID=3063788 RepID=A0ABU3NYK7_9FIRM|nr:hypothetical protein [Selenomonadales bacterium 4137-cl]
MVIVLVLVLLGLIVLSLWLRVRFNRDSVAGVETKSSPVALAVQELVATAGGVYLAIVALTSFLKLDMPDKVSLMAVAVDPLAVTAIVLAIVQPLFSRLFLKILHK